MTDHLTKPNADLEAMRERTIPGMAHWAGSGPKGKVCGECEFYTLHNIGIGRSPRCRKYFMMMRMWGRTLLPLNTPSCKYFSRG